MQSAAFFNLYNHNFVRVAAAIPRVRVANTAFNAEQTISLMEEAHRRKALLVAFPELGLSGYSCDDLFHQQALLDGCRDALGAILEASSRIPVITVVGLPLAVRDLLFNCAAVLYGGSSSGLPPRPTCPTIVNITSCGISPRRTMLSARVSTSLVSGTCPSGTSCSSRLKSSRLSGFS